MANTILRIVEEKGIERIIKVKIKIGEMQQVEHEIFRTALTGLKPAELKDAEFIIEIVKRARKPYTFFQSFLTLMLSIPDAEAQISR